jgi:carboxypeptidase family protein
MPKTIGSLLLFLCGIVTAQTNGNVGSIGGFVSDSKGAALAHAAVRVANGSTAFERRTLTNDSGMYEFDALPPGSYSVRVEDAGFSVSVQQIALTLGGTVRVNLGLSIAGNAQTVELSGAATSVAESIPTDVLMQDQIRELPIDGRRFQDFATLSSTVQALPETLGQLSFAGQRGIYSNIMLDGTDYNEPFLGGIRGGDRSDYAFTIPQTAIQEFQAVREAPSVEYGRTTGGILNATTRSGSNAFHGESFYQIRDQALGADDPLGRQVLERQQQFGGGLGGPIQKDRLFFFAAAEQQFANFPRSVSYPALNAFAGQVTPDIAPAYNYLRSLEGPFNQTNNATAVFGRADYQTRRGDRVSLRYDYSRDTAGNAVAPGVPELPQLNQSLSSNGTAREVTNGGGGQWTSVFSGMVNDLHVQYGREDSALVPNAIAPYVDLGVIGSFGTAPNLPTSYSDYRFQAADGLSFIRGRHSISLGFDYSYLGVQQHAGDSQFGSFTITADPLQALQILSGAAGTNRFDNSAVTYSRQVGSLQFNGNVHQAALYAQDSWRVTSTFTLAAGLRWEGQFNPQPVADNPFLVSNVQGFAFPLGRLDPTVIRNQLAQWSPRASFAWDPTGGQHTIIRGKAGIFYAQTPLVYLAGPLTDVSMAPSNLTLQIAPNSAGTVYQQFLAGGFDFNHYSLNNLPIFTVPDVWVQVAGKPNPFAQANVITTSGNNFRNPSSAQVGLSAEHRLTSGLHVFYEFDHLVTSHLERNIDWNVPVPFVQPGDQSLRPFFGLRSGTPRPNPNLGWVLVRDSGAHANYTGHTFRVEYRVRQLLLGAHYTLSFNKSNDDNERQLTGITYQNPYDFSREYNWSSIDARHQAAGYAVWQGPRGIMLSSLFHFRSGLPIDASTGGDTSQLLSGNIGNRPIVLPGLPMLRNAFRNQGYRDVDLRIVKSIVRRETLRVELTGDLFNAFNFNNVAFISSTVYPDNPAFIYGLGVLSNGQPAPVNPGFLKLRTATGAYDPQTTAQQGIPLQAQLGLRLSF